MIDTIERSAHDAFVLAALSLERDIRHIIASERRSAVIGVRIETALFRFRKMCAQIEEARHGEGASRG